jgi:predicted transcriptional regulator
MDKIYKTMPVSSDVLDIANEFLKSNYKRFLIVDEKGRLIGQVSRRDILKAIKAMNITTWHKGS